MKKMPQTPVVKKKPANSKMKPMPKRSAGRLGMAKVHLKSRAQRGSQGRWTALRMLSAKQKEKKKRGT